MNPILIFLAIISTIGLWFLLSFLYKPIGKLFTKLWKDSFKAINEVEKKNINEEKEKK